MPTAATTASSDQNRLKLPTRLHDEAEKKLAMVPARNPSDRCPFLAPNRIVFEEQGLADECGNHGFLIWLGNQERRFRPFAGEKAFRICRNEDYWNLECGDQVIDGFQSGAPVRQLDICENKAGTFRLGPCYRLRSRARNPHAAVTEVFDDVFEVERDQGLILNYQNVGGDLGGEFSPGFID